MSRVNWTAPAKVNLTLRLLGRRNDGFHEIESLMAPLDLGDVLGFEKADKFSLVCDTPGVPLDESNLVTMAVRSFEERIGSFCGWRITLEKHVPHGAGLGGGSSDAATTLLALNELEGAGLTRGELAEMGAGFGSDVPFFIYQQPCMVGGRGEVVRPVEVPGLENTSILLLKPGFGVATPDAYKNCLNAEALPGIYDGVQGMPWGELVNDLEKPVFYKHRFLAEMKDWLLGQPEVDAAMMSGSGSTMIAFVPSEQAERVAVRARGQLDPTLWVQKAMIAPTS